MRWVVVVALAMSTRVEAQPRPITQETPKNARGAKWKLQVPERLELSHENVGTLPIVIHVDGGQSISKDADLILDLAPEPGLSIKHRRLGRSDAVAPDDASLRFAVPVGGPRVGDYAVKLRLRFWLCGTKVCWPIDARRTVSISVR